MKTVINILKTPLFWVFILVGLVFIQGGAYILSIYAPEKSLILLLIITAGTSLAIIIAFANDVADINTGTIAISLAIAGTAAVAVVIVSAGATPFAVIFNVSYIVFIALYIEEKNEEAM